jgi:hypothetical protein
LALLKTERIQRESRPWTDKQRWLMRMIQNGEVVRTWRGDFMQDQDPPDLRELVRLCESQPAIVEMYSEFVAVSTTITFQGGVGALVSRDIDPVPEFDTGEQRTPSLDATFYIPTGVPLPDLVFHTTFHRHGETIVFDQMPTGVVEQPDHFITPGPAISGPGVLVGQHPQSRMYLVFMPERQTHHVIRHRDLSAVVEMAILP